jgi:HSP20 family molecular chaperone IbpA
MHLKTLHRIWIATSVAAVVVIIGLVYIIWGLTQALSQQNTTANSSSNLLAPQLSQSILGQDWKDSEQKLQQRFIQSQKHIEQLRQALIGSNNVNEPWSLFEPSFFENPLIDNSLFEQFMLDGDEAYGGQLDISMKETEKHFEVEIKHPESQSVSIDAYVENNQLVISGATKQQMSKNGTYQSMQEFKRSLTLPHLVKNDSLAVEHQDGRIIINIEKATS